MSAGVARVAVAGDAVLTPLADCHDGVACSFSAQRLPAWSG
jgi:hypothetical protein